MEKCIYGTSERIFVNTAIGCNACCKYCYMPKLGHKKKEKTISGEMAVQQVLNMTCFFPGKNGTVLSLGCYSECLDLQNMKETETVVQGLLPLGNRIQLATKQIVTEHFLEIIKRYQMYDEQMHIYISMPTISLIEQLESGTALANQRITNIENCIRHNIPVVLYIKPFLENITESDLEKYIKIVRKYRIPAVVGGYLYTEPNGKLADVGNGRLYEGNLEFGRIKFINELRKHTQVYEHSTEKGLL